MKPDIAIVALVISICTCFENGLRASTLLPRTVPTDNNKTTTSEEETNFALTSSCIVAKNIFVSELGDDNNDFVYNNEQTGKFFSYENRKHRSPCAPFWL